MALTESFYEAVNNGDVRKLHIMMKNSLLVDTTFKELGEMQSKAASVPGLYDVHDGKPFVLDKSEWNDDYMHDQDVQLMFNFSRERLDHLKEVVRTLRPNDNESIKPHNDIQGRNGKPQASYKEQKARDQQSGVYIGPGTKMAFGAVAGGVVGTGVAVVFSAPVLPCALGGAAVGIGVAAVALGGKKHE